jgi:GNAT superfamily N-acetyltransferase
MVLEPTARPPAVLPPGFLFAAMRPGDEAGWAEIWNDAAPERPVAATRFAEVFGRDWDVIAERCVFLREQNGRAVGTVSAWFDPPELGESAGRVHWLAVRRSFQGRGLARVLLAHALACRPPGTAAFGCEPSRTASARSPSISRLGSAPISGRKPSAGSGRISCAKRGTIIARGADRSHSAS